MNLASDWNDYQILDMANGEKLEKWNNITLVRPDPQIIWKQKRIVLAGCGPFLLYTDRHYTMFTIQIVQNDE